MPDADDAARLFAFRRWRDESGAVLRAAQSGIALAKPACPTLLLASECDDDVPLATSRDLAAFLGAELRVLAGASHVGPLLGRDAAACADAARRWLADQH
jgi:pimeloyl-ACP methyl ester carboxylesterase